MSMNEPEPDQAQSRFEQRLREFRPVAPRALAMPVRRAPWGALAVAAALLLCIALSIVKLSRHPEDTAPVAQTNHAAAPRRMVPRPVTLGKLNAALRSSDRDLNEMLDEASPQLLPREHHGTVLFELGKE